MMAPLWKVMLSKSSPLYRDSLFSFSLWEWKVQERELLLLKKHTDWERRAMLAQLNKLSKELQEKDKVIESLHAKLNQHHHHPSHRSDTPCSSHALSDTTDQSDCISYVSDEHGSAKEDPDLYSDVNAASELGQEDVQTSTSVSIDGHSCCGTMSGHPSVAPSITPSHRGQACLSCSSMQCSGSPHKPTAVQSQTGFSTPQSKPLQGFPFAHQQPDSSGFPSLSYRGFQPSPIATAASSSTLDACLAVKAGANLLHRNSLLDLSYGMGPMRAGADLSSGSSGYQSGTSITGSDLMKEHLTEIRSLRRRLEDSIQTNDRLRQQLEERLACTATEKGAPTNIYIQGLDSASQLSNEIRLLKEKNVNLENQLKQITRESNKEAEQLREAAFLEQSRLREAELEAERWAEQSRKLQAEAESHSRETTQLKQHRLRDQETINRLQHDVSIVRQQLCESHSLVHTLQCELHMYHGVCGVTPNTPSGQVSASDQPGHSTITFDPKMLRIPLDQQLSEQNDTQPGARRQLLSAASTLQEQVPHCPFANSNGHHAVSHMDNFKALQQQILEGSALLRRMEAALYSLSSSQELFLKQPSDTGSVRKLLSDTKTLRQILDEADSLIRMFWRAALPDSEEPKQDQSLTEEVVSLRLKLSERDQALKDVMEKVKSSNSTKDSMEHFIVSQLSRTQDVLRRAKINLKVKTQGASVSPPSLLAGVL